MVYKTGLGPGLGLLGHTVDLLAAMAGSKVEGEAALPSFLLPLQPFSLDQIFTGLQYVSKQLLQNFRERFLNHTNFVSLFL